MDAANLEDEVASKAWEAEKAAPKEETVKEKVKMLLAKGTLADAAPVLAAKRPHPAASPLLRRLTKVKVEEVEAASSAADSAAFAVFEIGPRLEARADWEQRAACHLDSTDGMHAALSGYSMELISKYLTYRFVRERTAAR